MKLLAQARDTEPLTVVDLAGVGLRYKGTKALYPVLDDAKAPHNLLTRMVEQGFHGKKAGREFFEYPLNAKTDIIRDRGMGLWILLGILYPPKSGED